jgi:hypothetical protein
VTRHVPGDPVVRYACSDVFKIKAYHFFAHLLSLDEAFREAGEWLGSCDNICCHDGSSPSFPCLGPGTGSALAKVRMAIEYTRRFVIVEELRNSSNLVRCKFEILYTSVVSKKRDAINDGPSSPQARYT